MHRTVPPARLTGTQIDAITVAAPRATCDAKMEQYSVRLLYMTAAIGTRLTNARFAGGGRGDAREPGQRCNNSRAGNTLVQLVWVTLSRLSRHWSGPKTHERRI